MPTDGKTQREAIEKSRRFRNPAATPAGLWSSSSASSGRQCRTVLTDKSSRLLRDRLHEERDDEAHLPEGLERVVVGMIFRRAVSTLQPRQQPKRDECDGRADFLSNGMKGFISNKLASIVHVSHCVGDDNRRTVALETPRFGRAQSATSSPKKVTGNGAPDQVGGAVCGGIQRLQTPGRVTRRHSTVTADGCLRCSRHVAPYDVTTGSKTCGSQGGLPDRLERWCVCTPTSRLRRDPVAERGGEPRRTLSHPLSHPRRSGWIRVT